MPSVMLKSKTLPQMINNIVFKRSLSIAIDHLIITYSLIFSIFGFSKPFSNFIQAMTDIEIDLKFQLARILVFVIYCAIMEASIFQGTIGKKIFSVKVVDSNNQRIDPIKSLTRNFSKILSGIPFLFGFIWAFYDQNEQAWHDKIAKTHVIFS
jgi:uncharacterized RDD family membrane protein YckC